MRGKGVRAAARRARLPPPWRRSQGRERRFSRGCGKSSRRASDEMLRARRYSSKLTNGNGRAARDWASPRAFYDERMGFRRSGGRGREAGSEEDGRVAGRGEGGGMWGRGEMQVLRQQGGERVVRQVVDWLGFRRVCLKGWTCVPRS